MKKRVQKRMKKNSMEKSKQQCGKLGYGKVFLLAIMLIVIISGFVSAYTRSNPAYTQFSVGGAYTGSSLDASACDKGGQDFVIQIAPLGCEPAVVRSDLLEEQDVPVFCQLAATKINPLIDVEAIESLSLSGEYPPEVAGLGFQPVRAALGVQGNLNSPTILENIGYAVIILKKQVNSSSLPENVSGTINARLRYDIQNAFGIGKASFYLPLLSDAEWEEKQNQYSFWGGRGYLRLNDVSVSSEGSASVSVYDGSGNVVNTVNLVKGQNSKRINLPGFDCLASLNLRLEAFEVPQITATLKVGDDILELAKGQRFLQDKCSVLKIEKQGLVQKVTLQCREDTREGYMKGKSFELTVDPKIILAIGENNKEYGVGDIIISKGGSNLFVGYLGVREKDNTLFMIPVVSNAIDKATFLKSSDLATVKSIGQVVEKSNAEDKLKESVRIISILKSSSGNSNFGLPFKKGDSKGVVYMKDQGIKVQANFTFVGFIGAQDFAFDSSLILVEQYYDNANKDYDKVIGTYPSEPGLADKDKLDAKQEALKLKIELAIALRQKNSLITLCEDYRSSYPDFPKLNECKDSFLLASSEVASVFVLVNGRSTRISFDGIDEPSFEEYGASINLIGAGLNDGVKKLAVGERVLLSSGESTRKDFDEFFELTEVRENAVQIYAEYIVESGEKKVLKKGKLSLDLDGFVRLGFRGYELRLADVNIEKIARVSVNPSINNAGSEVSFDFNIGIEKRSIQLSPGKTKVLIKRMNASIEDFEEKADKLGKVVKGLKGACVIAGMAITVKNFFGNLGGAGTARQSVMNGPKGWKERCVSYVSAGKGPDGKVITSQQDCYNTYSSEIDKEVALATRVIKEQNDQIKEDQKEAGKTKAGWLGDDVVDTNEYMRISINRVKDDYLSKGGSVSDGKGNIINRTDVAANINKDAWQNQGTFTQYQLRDIEYYERILDSNPSEGQRAASEARLYSLYHGIGEASKTYKSQTDFAKGFGTAADVGFLTVGDSTKKLTYTGKTAGDIGDVLTLTAGLASDTPVQAMITSTGQKFFVPLNSNPGLNQLSLQTIPVESEDDEGKTTTKTDFIVYDHNGKRVDQDKIPSELKKSYFIRLDSKSLSGNRIKNPKVKYYETEPYVGLPAIVPFEVNNGWYAATRQTLPVGRGIASFGKSGRVESFYLCNAGVNGLIQFETGLGDDHCEMINLGTGQSYNQFGSLGKEETSRLIKKAVNAIEQASNAHKSGVSSVNIFGIAMKVGSPASNIPDIECQDIMSPTDCKILFNLCDPVVCPSSRCNFGGEYNVRDVIQSGIIGSALLCLPNIKEGIIIPVCLSGIKAGLDAHISVLRSYRDCLQTSLDTGQQVGICDEVYSVHLCTLFWEQAMPMAEILIPKAVGAFTGQSGSRGGGEYMNVQNAWDTASQSADYFTDYYGANAFEAFQVRSLEQVGSLVCKSQISGVYPNSADLFDQLIEPESPPQYHGRFDEIPFTTTTNPPISHYKVLFHIYAGDGGGAYYSVYLKPGPGGSFYQDVSRSRVVDQGFIPPGDYASETIDFTAPTGYKEMCISVNGQEECGFGEVSTSFVVDYLSDLYKAEQASERNIKTESDCISGTTSVYSFLNPNIESVARELIDPAIYNQGLIRTCATNNPGQGTDANIGTNNSRWVNVGYCGQQQLKCWLDTDSVKNAIQGIGLEQDVISGQADATLKGLNEEGKYVSEEVFEDKLSKINSESDSQEAFNEIADLMNKVYLNSQKVKLLLTRANIYAKLANLAFRVSKSGIAKAKQNAAKNGVGEEKESGKDGDAGVEGDEAITSDAGKTKITLTDAELDAIAAKLGYPTYFDVNLVSGGNSVTYRFIISPDSDENNAIYDVLIGTEKSRINLDPSGTGIVGTIPSIFSIYSILNTYREFKEKGSTLTGVIQQKVTIDASDIEKLKTVTDLLREGAIVTIKGDLDFRKNYALSSPSNFSGELIINGSINQVSSFAELFAKGKITVNGDVINSQVGSSMTSGTITINGNVLGESGYIGREMYGGIIKINGKVNVDGQSSSIGGSMSSGGGRIEITGEVNLPTGTIGRSLSTGQIIMHKSVIAKNIGAYMTGDSNSQILIKGHVTGDLGPIRSGGKGKILVGGKLLSGINKGPAIQIIIEGKEYPTVPFE